VEMMKTLPRPIPAASTPGSSTRLAGTKHIFYCELLSSCGIKRCLCLFSSFLSCRCRIIMLAAFLWELSVSNVPVIMFFFLP
jgi:hypothetical protein